MEKLEFLNLPHLAVYQLIHPFQMLNTLNKFLLFFFLLPSFQFEWLILYFLQVLCHRFKSGC